MFKNFRDFAHRLIVWVNLIATILPLGLVLAYNYYHTGALLARYIVPPGVGYVTALGIELSVVALSVQISTVKQRGVNPYLFYGVLVSVVIVSMLANLAEGYYARYSTELTLTTITSLDPLQAVVWFAATALLSLIVMALAEISGQLIIAAINPQETRNHAPAVARAVNTSTQPTKLTLALEAYRKQPGLSARAIAHQVGCSISTARNAINTARGAAASEV